MLCDRDGRQAGTLGTSSASCLYERKQASRSSLKSMFALGAVVVRWAIGRVIGADDAGDAGNRGDAADMAMLKDAAEVCTSGV